MDLPQRPEQHVLETLSRRYFEHHLPRTWTASKPEHDYGIDLIVNIFDGTNASPYELAVQLKASQAETVGDNEKIILKLSTYNHLRRLLPVVLLVKYVAASNEAYYVLLAKIPEPAQKQQSFTVNIPKQNRLSELGWDRIELLVREIVDYKLASGDAIKAAMKEQGLL